MSEVVALLSEYTEAIADVKLCEELVINCRKRLGDATLRRERALAKESKLTEALHAYCAERAIRDSE